MKQPLNALGLEVRRQVLALTGTGLRSNYFLIGQLRKENAMYLMTQLARLAKGLAPLACTGRETCSQASVPKTFKKENIWRLY